MADNKRQRTCVTCTATKRQDDLVRFVKEKTGHVVLDIKGKTAGRGAYVCSKACLEASLSSGRLERALRTRIVEEDEKSILSSSSEMFLEDR